MGRKAHANYIEAATSVLEELGGGPISTKTLVAAAQERGLVGDGDWVYHNFSRKVRESDLFDTTVRGQISLLQERPGSKGPDAEAPGTGPDAEAASKESLVTEVVAEPETAPVETTEAETNFPGPTIGAGFGN